MSKSIGKSILQGSEGSSPVMTCLTFQIDGQCYGILAGDVIEILQLQPATRMPELPDYFKGVINLRGHVIPLMDVALRLGGAEKSHTDRSCIIIVDIDGFQIGLIVDAVGEVLSIDDEMILETPTLSYEGAMNHISRIVNIDSRMVFLMNLRPLISGAI